MGRGILSNTKGVGAGDLEYRIDFGPGYRIYFGRDGNTLIVLLGAAQRDVSGGTSRPPGGFGGTMGVDGRRNETMALTRDFKVTVRERLQRDPSFREALLKKAVDCLLSSDVATGKSLLCDYVNATIGFDELGGLTAKSPKRLMHMLSQNGNPQAHDLFEIIGCIQQLEGVHLKVQAVKVTDNFA